MIYLKRVTGAAFLSVLAENNTRARKDVNLSPFMTPNTCPLSRARACPPLYLRRLFAGLLPLPGYSLSPLQHESFGSLGATRVPSDHHIRLDLDPPPIAPSLERLDMGATCRECGSQALQPLPALLPLLRRRRTARIPLLIVLLREPCPN